MSVKKNSKNKERNVPETFMTEYSGKISRRILTKIQEFKIIKSHSTDKLVTTSIARLTGGL